MSQPTRAPTNLVPLSQMQRQLWAVQQLFPETAVHNTAWRFDLGKVDAARFEVAFERLVQRLDALRMVVEMSDDTPMLRVLAGCAGQHENEQVASSEALDSALEARACRAFDMTKQTVDSVLYQTPDGAAVWLINLHHIINDGASGPVLFKAMAECYAAGAEGLDPLPSFADHLSTMQVSQDDRSFWDNWRRAAPGAPRHYGQALSGTQINAVERRITLSVAQTKGLAALGTEKGFATLSPAQTVFQVFQTSLMAWMHRTSGEDRLALGIATHGRATPQARQMAGCFVDIFPVEARVQPEESFRTLHAKMRAANLTHLRHATPGSFTAKGAARFSTVLNAFPVGFADFDGHPVDATWLGNGCTDPTHALRLNLMDKGEAGHELKFLFNAEVVPKAEADHAVAHFLALLDALIANPDTLISAVPLVQPKEASQQLMAPLAVVPEVEDVITAVTRLAAEAPDALVLSDETGTWTRAELARRTDAIVDLLLAQDVGPGSRIGIHLTRSGHLVAALLATLKVGASFIPLDPGQPEGRLDIIAAEAQLALVLTEPDIARAWPDATPTALVTDLPDPTHAHKPEAAPRAAYVLFTSGSTGRPKGVQVGRKALSRYAHWAQLTFAGPDPAAWAVHSAIGFDLTLTSIFAPLVTGGTLRIYRETLEGPDLCITRVFSDDAVEVVKLTPRHLTLALQDSKPLKNIRSLVLGGEELTTALCRQTLDTCGPHLASHNEYGPTEATVGCMDHIFDPAHDTGATVPIGRPAEVTQITVRDAALNAVPDRVVGEIYIAGQDRLADGYFANAEATRAAFIDDPLTGQRMYRTGDLASVRPDGVILYHGRADEQLKMSGIRIERGEITNAVLDHPLISSAHVVNFDPTSRTETFCISCGISDRVPDVSFDGTGQCSLCQDFERYRTHAQGYFGKPSDLNGIVAEAASQKSGKS